MTRQKLIGARLICSAFAGAALFGGSTLLAGNPPSTNAPLAAAIQQMDKAAIRRLLEHPVDINATQPDGMTALHWAAYQDDVDLVDQLLRAGANARAANRYGVTPLSLACTNANVAMVEHLLAAGADANATLPGGETVLMTAARTGRVGAVRALLVRGAEVNAKENRHGQTAVMWAAAEGHVEVLQALIEAGADFKTPLSSGFTPLLFAVREGRIGAVKTLLKAGANVNDAGAARAAARLPEGGAPALRAGITPLFMAVSNAHFELASVLLDNGADPNAAALGYTVLHAIVKVRKPGVGDNDPAPEGSGSVTSLEFVKRLIAKGANVNARMTRRVNLTNTRFNEVGATPFLLAAVTADAELMKTLADLGADPLLTNDDNSTALMAAAGIATRSPGEDAGTEDEVIEAMQLALSLGADLNAVDKHGETAMHGAAYKNLSGAVKFLADKGARIDIWNRKNEFGWTPLTIARGYRFGNFKPSQVTIDAIEAVMRTAGITPPTEKEEKATAVDIYAPKPPAPKPTSPR